MGAMSARTKVLYSEVEAAVLAAVEKTGGVEVKPADVVRLFSGRGVTRSTLFRWLAGIMTSIRTGQITTADKVVDLLPVRVSSAQVSGSPAQILEGLGTIIRDVQAVVHDARYGGRATGNAKLTLQAAEVLRRCLETAAKVTASMHRVDRVKEFHEAIIQEIAKEDRELARRVVQRLTQITNTWGLA